MSVSWLPAAPDPIGRTGFDRSPTNAGQAMGAHLIYPGTYNHPLMHRQALLLADVLLG
jgi:hypothetical protein